MGLNTTLPVLTMNSLIVDRSNYAVHSGIHFPIV